MSVQHSAPQDVPVVDIDGTPLEVGDLVTLTSVVGAAPTVSVLEIGDTIQRVPVYLGGYEWRPVMVGGYGWVNPRAQVRKFVPEPVEAEDGLDAGA
jgi:hypothetical protein